MEIAKLGEFGLIDRLTKDIKTKNESTKYGVGDDCAVLSYPDKQVLVTTDLLMEGVHFDLTYTPLKHLGYKAVAVNLSDIYAMNGTPRQITVSLGISKRFTVEHINELYSGIYAACERYGIDLVGGDTSASVTGLLISITCLGEAQDDEIVYRGGARSERHIWAYNCLSVSEWQGRDRKTSNPTSLVVSICSNDNSSLSHAPMSSPRCGS